MLILLIPTVQNIRTGFLAHLAVSTRHERVYLCFQERQERHSEKFRKMGMASQAALLVALLLCRLCNLPAHGDSLVPSAVISKQRITAKGREYIHGSVSGRRPRPTKEFLYVYDMPSKFTSDIKKLSVEWHPEQYDYDQVRYSHMHTA